LVIRKSTTAHGRAIGPSAAKKLAVVRSAVIGYICTYHRFGLQQLLMKKYK